MGEGGGGCLHVAGKHSATNGVVEKVHAQYARTRAGDAMRRRASVINAHATHATHATCDTHTHTCSHRRARIHTNTLT